jgi:hypothetical protein
MMSMIANQRRPDRNTPRGYQTTSKFYYVCKLFKILAEFPSILASKTGKSHYKGDVITQQ